MLRRLSLSLLIALLAAAPAAATPKPERQAYLRDLVKNECTRCHGYKRIGQNGPPLRPEDLEYIDKDYLVRTIMNGRNTQMPAWKGMLSLDDVEYIAYVILLEPAP